MEGGKEEENISQIIISKKLKVCQNYRLYICRKYKSEIYTCENSIISNMISFLFLLDQVLLS